MADYTNPIDGKPLVKWSPRAAAEKKIPGATSSAWGVGRAASVAKDVAMLRKAGYSRAQIARGLVGAGHAPDLETARAWIEQCLEGCEKA